MTEKGISTRKPQCLTGTGRAMMLKAYTAGIIPVFRMVSMFHIQVWTIFLLYGTMLFVAKGILGEHI